MKLNDLAVDHSYYCSTSNYYSNDAGMSYVTWPEFYAEYHDADIDMNLVFRWDIKEHTSGYGETEKRLGTYHMEIFMMGQRKGLFKPITISRVFDEDVESILSYLQPHLDYLNTIWLPLTKSV